MNPGNPPHRTLYPGPHPGLLADALAALWLWEYPARTAQPAPSAISPRPRHSLRAWTTRGRRRSSRASRQHHSLSRAHRCTPEHLIPRPREKSPERRFLQSRFPVHSSRRRRRLRGRILLRRRDPGRGTCPWPRCKNARAMRILAFRGTRRTQCLNPRIRIGVPGHLVL